MTTRISNGDIARIVGPDAFIRGQDYAENGRVVSCDWFAGTRLFGSVKGTRSTAYAVSVALTPESGHLTRGNVHYGKITSGVHS